MEWKVKVVLHTEFGGFSLTPEMFRRLKKRGCKWADQCGHDDRKESYWLPYQHEIGPEAENLRKDPNLVAVVEELLAEYETKIDQDESLTWREKVDLCRAMTANLKVVEVRVVIEIDDHDGNEKVRVTGGVW